MSKTWVIGGRRGIGEAIVKELEDHPGAVVLATDENDADVRSRREIERQFNHFQPDFIVYCAGINKLMPLKDWDEFSALDILDINALGFMQLAAIVAGVEDLGKPDAIVAVSSDAATRPMRSSMAYCVSKAALNMAVRCAARELAPRVRVNAVSPGIVDDTPMTEDIDKQVEAVRHWTTEEAAQYELSSIPMGRRAYKNEVAAMVYNILDSPQYLTGSIIEMNGGR